MSARGPGNFRKQLKEAVEAFVAAGIEPRVEIDPITRKMVVTAGKPPDAATDAQDAGAVAKDRIAAMRREANG
jgi:hypothetical protein